MSIKRIVLCVVISLLIATMAYTQTDFSRDVISPPFKGLITNYDSWVLSKDSFAEADNVIVNELGLLRGRQQIYTFKKDNGADVIGGVYYPKISGGTETKEVVVNVGGTLYSSSKDATTFKNISSGFGFNTAYRPFFDVYMNRMFMANGANSPVSYYQDSNNVTQLGRSTYTGRVTFTDANSICNIYTEVITCGISLTKAPAKYLYNKAGSVYVIRGFGFNDSNTWDNIAVGDKLEISGTKWNNRTVPILDKVFAGFDLLVVDYCALELINDDRPITLTIHKRCTTNADEYVTIKTASDMEAIPYHFRPAMDLIIADSNSDGTYEIDYVDGNKMILLNKYSNTVTLEADGNISLVGVSYPDLLGSSTGTNTFCPSVVVGHKSRMFAAGVTTAPTILFYSVSRVFSEHFYDIWRDRWGKDDGSGWIDMQDEIIALAPNYKDALIIFCKNSIYALSGVDPGSDILTASESYIFHPQLISDSIGCINANAWCYVGDDVYFYSKNGLRHLANVNENLSLQVHDTHRLLVNTYGFDNIYLRYLQDTETVYVLVNSLVSWSYSYFYAYSVRNKAFTTFAPEKKILCIFNGENYTGLNPLNSLWLGTANLMGDDTGRTQVLVDSNSCDLDCSDPNMCLESNHSMNIVTQKLSMGDTFLRKTFRTAKVLCKKMTGTGVFYFYYKIDNGSWSSVSSASATAEYGTYRFELKGTGKVIQYKITSTDRYGLELASIMTEYEPIDYRL
jgi:hypothetical protein